MSKHYMYLHREIQVKTYFAYFEPTSTFLYFGDKSKVWI